MIHPSGNQPLDFLAFQEATVALPPQGHEQALSTRKG